MISDNFWKILFLLMVFTGLFFWFKGFNESKRFKGAASDLADLITFAEDSQPRNAEEAQQRFFKAVYIIQEAQEEGIDTALLMDAALEYNDTNVDSPAADLIRKSLFDSHVIGEKLGIFNDESMWDLQDGTAVKITEGPHKEERIAVAHIVSPTVAETARFFLGNMILVPESVAAINRDLELTEKVYNTSIKLTNADVINSETAKAIKDNYYLQRERNKY